MLEYNEVAAKWWADKLRNVGPGSFNNGEETSLREYARLFATMVAMNSKVSDEVIDAFEKRLAQAIKDEVKFRGSVVLNVDYVPLGLLAEIATETGVICNNFPWKTTMWIKDRNVVVSAGYRAPSQVILE